MNITYRSSKECTVFGAQAVLQGKDRRWRFKGPPALRQCDEMSMKVRVQVLDQLSRARARPTPTKASFERLASWHWSAMLRPSSTQRRRSLRRDPPPIPAGLSVPLA